MWGVKVARVRGTSMLPQFGDSDYVIAINWPYLNLQPGHVVLVSHPSLGLIIKRIFAIHSQYYKLVGDHPSSISPDQMGLVERSKVLGLIVFHISNPLSR